jgi:hypothetical protein
MEKLLSLGFASFLPFALHAADARPNIVWIVGEDMGPELGCYGDAQAITPNMDRRAKAHGSHIASRTRRCARRVVRVSSRANIPRPLARIICDPN